MRVNRLPALLLLAGCAASPATAPPAPDGRVFGEEVSSLGAATAEASERKGRTKETSGSVAGEAAVTPGPASPEAADPEIRERALRHLLAEAENPVPAALELADLLIGGERHEDALAVVETALRRSAEDARLLRLRASLLRDVARRPDALEALRAFDRSHPDVDPTVLLEIAELEWLRAGREAAAEALADLDRRFPSHPWFEANRAHVEDLARELVDAERPRSVSVRDLLADLRGAPLPSTRLRAFHALQHASPETRRRAVVVALADPSGPVRAEAVELAALPKDELAALCRAALDDEDWQVRAAVAHRAQDLPRRVACGLLVDGVGREEEPAAFLAMHDALQELSGEEVELPPGGSSRADVRARVAEKWRRWWGQ